MTVTRVPASNPEPEVPITDPRWLVSTQPDPTPEIPSGLDGRGTTRAADLPATSYTWPSTTQPAVTEDLALEAEPEVRRTLCLEVSGDLSVPLQCRFKLGHLDGHDWEIEKTVLAMTRHLQLREEQDTPSGRLPVRTPGAALEEEREVIERWPA